MNNGYLEEGNVKVAVRLIRQKIAHFVQQKRNRTISMNHEAQLAARRASSDSVDSRSTDVEGLLDTPRDRSDSTESQASTEQQVSSLLILLFAAGNTWFSAFIVVLSIRIYFLAALRIQLSWSVYG